jgi:hypothetical protein
MHIRQFGCDRMDVGWINTETLAGRQRFSGEL